MRLLFNLPLGLITPLKVPPNALPEDWEDWSRCADFLFPSLFALMTKIQDASVESNRRQGQPPQQQIDDPPEHSGARQPTPMAEPTPTRHASSEPPPTTPPGSANEPMSYEALKVYPLSSFAASTYQQQSQATDENVKPYQAHHHLVKFPPGWASPKYITFDGK